MSDFETRFGGIARLYGQSGLEKLRAAHVCVVGIGGVGTWAAEALARSGVGEDMVRGCRAWVSFASRQLFLAVPDTEQNAKGQITLACPTSSP